MNVEYLQKSATVNQNCKQFGIKIKTVSKPKSASVFFSVSKFVYILTKRQESITRM